MTIFYICSFFTFYGKSILFIILYVLMMICNRRNKYDLILTLLALICSITNLFVEYNVLGIS